jgi:PBP1b-binding outer membrane lipoprotein LpoB
MMRKILLIVALSLSLTGCASLQLATKTIDNPVTRTQEAEVELILDSAIQGLKTYKKACVDGAADVNCRANIARIQVYTRQVKPLVAQLRSFVDTNDQVNAIVVYNQLTALYTNIKAAAAAVGVNVGGSS